MAMKLPQPYATAIQRHGLPLATASTPVAEFQTASGRGMVHDISKGLPEAMLKADVLYSEVPYQKGYSVFYDRAGGVPLVPYAEFLAKLGSEMRRFGKPAYLLGPKISPTHLRPDGHAVCKCLGLEATISWWVDEPFWSDGSSTTTIINALASRHLTVADPLCGYGTTARIFVEAGKRFIVSDLNPDYIGWIAANCAAWSPNPE
jgi:hypothetical protein